MVKLSLFASLFGLVAITAANGGVCTRPPYARVVPLKGFPPAESFCSSKVTLARCTSTSTASVTKTFSETVATATVVTSTKVVTVVLGTSTLTSTTATITVTPNGGGSTSTVTTTTGTTTITTTSTAACTTASQKHSRHAVEEERAGRNLKRQPNKQHLLSYLKAQPSTYISTACSCIETPKPCITTTSTTTVMATTSITATTSVVATSKISITVTITVFTKTVTTLLPQPTTTTVSVEATSITTVTVTPSPCNSTPSPPSTPNQPLAGCTSGKIVSTDASACAYNNFCDMIADFPGSGKVPNGATTLLDCLNACSADSTCSAYIFDGSAVTCTLIETAAVFQIANPRADLGVAYGTYVSGSC